MGCCDDNGHQCASLWDGQLSAGQSQNCWHFFFSGQLSKKYLVFVDSHRRDHTIIASESKPVCSCHQGQVRKTRGTQWTNINRKRAHSELKITDRILVMLSTVVLDPL